MADLKRVNVLVSEEQHRKLRMMSAESGISMSEYLRRQIDALIRRWETGDEEPCTFTSELLQSEVEAFIKRYRELYPQGD